jgi:YjjG family noncanonical pyrimidine nucleotidase
MYSTIFFDLDHTLWDYDTCARETLHDLFVEYKLLERGIHRFDDFLQQFKTVNSELWYLYDHGKIDSDVIRKERFKQILERLNAYDEVLSGNLSEDYLNTCPRKGYLIPGALEALQNLVKNYSLTVITNGFEDIQRIKMEASNITSFFDHIITSQKAGFKKPAKEIFQFALGENRITSNQAIMIGDNLLTDIAGARNASIDTIFFNPDKVEHSATVKHEIVHLNELSELL